MAGMKTITIYFKDGEDGLQTRFEGSPSEGQFELAGRELIGIAERIRKVRLEAMIDVDPAPFLEMKRQINAPQQPTANIQKTPWSK